MLDSGASSCSGPREPAKVIGYVGPKGALRLQIIMIHPEDSESLRAMPANYENGCRLGGLVTGSSAFMAPC